MERLKEECPACQGKPVSQFASMRDFKIARCNLKGGKESYACVLCRGKGKVSRRRAVTYILRNQ